MSQQWNSEPSAGDDQDVQMPLGVGGESGAAEEYRGGDASRVRMNTSTVALVAAFAAALVVLYLLGLQNKPRVASAQEQKHAQELEEKITHMLASKGDQQQMNNFLNDTSRLLAVLNKYFESHVASSDLEGGNPFEREVVRVPETTDVKSTEPVIPADTEKAKRLLAIAAELHDLKVTAVMMGKSPAALVNNKLVTVGTPFKYLKVSDIQPDRVLLTADGDVYELKVANQQMNK